MSDVRHADLPAPSVVVILLLMTACVGGDGSPPPASPATGTDAESIVPLTSASADECVAPPSVCDGPIPPGSYASTSLGPTIQFELGEDWQGLSDLPEEGFGLVDRSQRAPAAIFVTDFPGEVFSDPCEVGPTEAVSGGAPGAADWISAQPFVADVQRSETTLGGRPAQQVDAAVSIGTLCPDPVVYLWPLPVSVEFHLNEAEQVRFIFVEAGGRTLAIIVEAFPDADVPGFLDRAATVLETLTIVD